MNTRIIIEGDEVSRILPDEFALCGDPVTMRRLGEEIVKQSQTLEGYGWVRVSMLHPSRGPANTSPISWSEGVK